MRVNEIMSTGPQYVGVDTSVVAAAKALREHDVGFLPVQKADKMGGMITDRDIALRVVAENKDPQETQARDAMTEGVYYVYDDRSAEVTA